MVLNPACQIIKGVFVFEEYNPLWFDINHLSMMEHIQTARIFVGQKTGFLAATPYLYY